VCLGAYATPQLLLVSGIGPREEVEKIGVPLQVEIDGVGKGLKDHLMAGPVYNTKPGSSCHFLTNDLKSVGYIQDSADVSYHPWRNGCTTVQGLLQVMWVSPVKTRQGLRVRERRLARFYDPIISQGVNRPSQAMRSMRVDPTHLI
jgi:choline dehydrogenase-like flavoprotein